MTYHLHRQDPEDAVGNVRNDMYLSGEALRMMKKSSKPAMSGTNRKRSTPIIRQFDNATKFIPDWVKVAVAIALGMGTMIGWKRIVVTVGERSARPT